MHSLPLDSESAAAELISILSTKGLEGTALAFETITKSNEMISNPQSIRRALARQVPILETLMNRLILSAHNSNPENGVKYLTVSLATHAALVKVLSALYETREIDNHA